MGKTPKVHLVTHPNAKRMVAVCGEVAPIRFTRSNPAVVTCGGCRKAVEMADLELAARQPGRR
jgi:hypothetical protein